LFGANDQRSSPASGVLRFIRLPLKVMGATIFFEFLFFVQ
jgi:hypothetical protein